MKFIKALLAYFKRQAPPVVYLTDEQATAAINALQPAIKRLEAATVENEVQAARHEAEAARLKLETECLRALVNIGVVKMKANVEMYDTRN